MTDPNRRKTWLKLAQSTNKLGNKSALSFEVAMCLPAYNEANNLRKLLPKLIRERDLTEIVVVASGCTDDTVEVAKSFDPHVRVLVQEKREGKASAINLFLRETSAPIVIMESTDTLPATGAIRRMLQHFNDSKVGAVGSRPIPTNVPNSIMGISAHILWKAHHLIASEKPKIGEMVAWRRINNEFEEFQLADTTAVDEAFIEAAINKAGYKLVYEPKAITYNRGPSNFKELVSQRKRIYRGHLSLKASGYQVSTLDPWKGLQATYKAAPKSIKGLAAWSVLMFAEAYSRITTDKKQPEDAIWQMAESTKGL